MSYLENWKIKKTRKPLIIRGARQVGKTTLVNNFALSFDQFLYFNLELKRERELFDAGEDIHHLVQLLFLYHGKKLNSGSTLVFIDEIQESQNAMKQLRYFYENYSELYVVTAGSLLEHALTKVSGFPVGRVEYLTLYPLNFIEYLHGIGAKSMAELIESTMPVPDYAQDTIKQHFHRYAIIGGMPEIVSIYSESMDITSLQTIFDSLFQGFTDDVGKYSLNPNQARIVSHIIDTAPMRFDERVTFQNFGGSNYRSREVGEAMRTLEKARLLYLNYPTVETTPPPIPDMKKKPRIQFLDTGLIVNKLSAYSDLMMLADLNDTMRGKLAQHLISQELQSIHTSPSYKNIFWVREKDSDAEIDLVYQRGSLIIPIEVKSGSKGRLRSLFEFMDRCNHTYAVRLYSGKFLIQQAKTLKGKNFTLMNMPYYLGTQIPRYIDHLVEKYQKGT